jgi:REP element-mobilizing transposase RayT
MAPRSVARAFHARYLFSYCRHTSEAALLSRICAVESLASGLLKVTSDFGWHLEAWAVFSNHYHFIAHSPQEEDGAESLSQMLGLLHEKTAKWFNRLDDTRKRKVWHNFRETRLTYEKSSFSEATDMTSHVEFL